MRDPAGHEQQWRSLCQVGGTENERRRVQEIPNVIEHHQNDHQAAQRVDCIEPQRAGAGESDFFGSDGRGRSLPNELRRNRCDLVALIHAALRGNRRWRRRSALAHILDGR
jgi:hypothetical protein